LLILVEILKLLAEIALLSLAGQWVLGLLAGAKREQNLFYQLFQIVTKPLVAGARLITPRSLILERHLPLVAFLVLAFTWVVVTFTKINMCIEMGVHLCK
jgi:hypothetical protein